MREFLCFLSDILAFACAANFSQNSEISQNSNTFFGLTNMCLLWVCTVTFIQIVYYIRIPNFEIKIFDKWFLKDTRCTSWNYLDWAVWNSNFINPRIMNSRIVFINNLKNLSNLKISLFLWQAYSQSLLYRLTDINFHFKFIYQNNPRRDLGYVGYNSPH